MSFIRAARGRHHSKHSTPYHDRPQQFLLRHQVVPKELRFASLYRRSTSVKIVKNRTGYM